MSYDEPPNPLREALRLIDDGMFDNRVRIRELIVERSEVHGQAVAALRSAVSRLANYGGHHSWCDASHFPRVARRRCSCGFVQELRAAEEGVKYAEAAYRGTLMSSERALIRAGPLDARDAEDDAWASREPGDDQSPPRPEGETA